MKYTKKDYAKFNIDLSECETYDDVVICTVEGNVNNGAPIDKNMFAQYCSIVKNNAITDFLSEAFVSGTTINFSNGDISISKDSMLNIDGKQFTVKKDSLIKRLWNWVTRKNK